MRHRTLWLVMALGSLLGSLPGAAWAQNLGIRDVPLKPWTGFARNWDWTYDALHRLVVSGLAGRVVMNTKPMSRREMALIIADIVRRVQENRVGEFDDRWDLQDTLLNLMEEFSPELRALGLTGFGIKGEPPRTVELKPVEFLQVRGGYTSNAATDLENRSGERLSQGVSGRVTTSSWLEAGGFLAAYAQPEFLIGSDTYGGRLVEGYVKGRAGPFELVVGRQPLWWGPGFHGSMLFSNNAVGLDMVRLQTANQITLPWVFRDLLGPLKFHFFFGTLEDERTAFPRSKVSGGRLDMAPFPWLEVGIARSIVFDGDGRPELHWYEYPRVLFFGNRPGTESSKYAGDNRFQVDATLRLANIGKYVPFSRDAELYLDFGWDDTCCESFLIPLKPGAIAGLYLPNLFLSPDTTFRAEYSWASSFQFTHAVWQDGFSRKGQVISHFEGTSGEDLYFRLTHRLDPRLDVGIELDFARRGRTQKGLEFATQELRRYVGVDVSYRHSNAVSLSAGARLEWVKDRDFIPGNDDINQVYTAALTYAFEPTIGTGRRVSLPPDALRPLTPPPRPPDPDQILSWEYAAKVAKDGWAVATSPTRWTAMEWLIAGGVAAATGGAMLVDKEIRDVTQGHRSQTTDTVANVVTNFGLIVPAAALAASYVAGEVFGDERAKQRGADGVEATILSNLMLVYPIKFLLGRSRPADERGSQDYRPFNISGSMPSFHTTQAFTAAAVLAEYADNPWVSAVAYALAAGVGWSRVHKDKHWFSDVVLSAAIGTAVGKGVVYLNKNRRESRISVVPLTDPDTWGAALQVKY
ncbi:MAG TPA: capsule assembly Wzi family protein [Candidatus Methylomirabilis sp.]|nr:capsule assembly Wzi family protein [Candidatus Methylomirabilis sp.]